MSPWQWFFGGLLAGATFAFARVFIQALLEDWQAWRSRRNDVVVNNQSLSDDSDFMLELDSAIRRSFARLEEQDGNTVRD